MAALPASSSIRIPAWAMARRHRKIQHSSPTSGSQKRIVRIEGLENLKMPSASSVGSAAGSPAAPTSATTTTTTSTQQKRVLLQMDVTGFSLKDLHVDIDPQTHRLCISGKGPRMFKRVFDMKQEALEAALQFTNQGRKLLLVRDASSDACVAVEDKENEHDNNNITSGDRRTIPIQDETCAAVRQ